MDKEGAAKSAQAAHVIEILLSGVTVSDQEGERATNYFSDGEQFDPEFLPWPTSPYSPLFHPIEDF